jgi:ElaB/YqjD/DUF883 family membrane-anchored ribosome-binding protein
MTKKADGLGETIKETFDSLKDSEQWEEVSEAAKKMSAEAAELVRKYPIQSVLGAAAAGFLLGALMNRKN